MRKALSVLGLSILLIAPFAQAQEATGLGGIYRIGVDARALGMGGAFVAVADNYSAPYWNPAGMSFMKGLAFGTMPPVPFELPLPFPFNLEKPNTASFSDVVFLGGVLPIQPLALGGGLFQAINCCFETVGPDGQPLGTAYADIDSLLIVSGSYRLWDALSLGLNAKLYRRDIAGESGVGMGADLGILARLFSVFYVGARADLWESRMQWTTGAVDRLDLARSFRIGSALKLGEGVLIGAIDYELLGQWVHVGMELDPLRWFFPSPFSLMIRFGSLFDPWAGAWTLGFGVRLFSFHLDLAAVVGDAPGVALGFGRVLLSTSLEF